MTPLYLSIAFILAVVVICMASAADDAGTEGY